jgi:hypothetical protein
MDAQEARAVEEELRNIAREHGLLWVADQVDEVLREGKPQFKRPPGRQPRERGELVPTEISEPRGVLASEPYSEEERASLLTSSIRRAVIDAAEVQEAAAEMLLVSGIAQKVEFVDDLQLEPPHDLAMDSQAWRDQRQERARLLSLLNTLEQRILGQDTEGDAPF